MKNILLLLLLLLFVSCSNEDNSLSKSPIFNIDLGTSQLEPAPGSFMFLKGVASDDNALKSIRIEIPEWKLDKTIYMNNNAKEYYLDYKFMAPNIIDDEKAQMILTICNVDGISKKYNFYINNSGDNVAPEIFTNMNIRQELQTLFKLSYNGQPKQFNLTFDAVDNKSIKSIKVECNDINYLKNISVNNASYHFSDELFFNENKKYTISINITDFDGNITNRDVAVLLTNLQDYDVIYLADVKTDIELQSDLFGVPIQTIKDSNYNYHIIYYNINTNAEVRFLTSTSTFSEMTFGQDSNGNFVSGENTTDVKPIILPKANQYYKISLNLEDRKIVTEEINVPTDPNANTKIGLLRGSSGWTESLSWNYLNSVEMTKYTKNTYLMWTDLEVNAEHKRLDYTFTGILGWNPQFRFIDAKHPDIVIPGTAGTFAQFPYEITRNKKYRFYLDTYTNRAKAIPVN